MGFVEDMQYYSKYHMEDITLEYQSPVGTITSTIVKKLVVCSVSYTGYVADSGEAGGSIEFYLALTETIRYNYFTPSDITIWLISPNWNKNIWN